MNILFRSDSSSTIGTGHIMRDLVLAKQYSDAAITFAIQDLESNINHKIKEAGYDMVILKSNAKEELDRLIKKLSIDLLVIDHYGIDYKQEKWLKVNNPALKILSFDDTYEKHYCDILLNHNINAEEKRYKGLVPRECELRCGMKYTLLREEFKVEKEIKRDKVYDVFIAMGGADTAQLNIKILEALPKDLKVVLVTTQANRHLEALQKYLKDKDNISLYINSNEIAKLINQSKLAIITPSVTVNEVLYLGAEFIAIKTADNQSCMAQYLQEKNYFILDSFVPKFLQVQVNKMIESLETKNNYHGVKI